jgi:ClpP class serine protease
MGAAAAITNDDDLPFIEMIQNAPAGIDKVDILIATPGGLAHQVAQFVDATRRRFKDVSFIIPQIAMSAGTIWVLSGNEIIMDERAVIGPIDPQVIGKSGQFLPSQSLKVLVNEIQERGKKALDEMRIGNPTGPISLFYETLIQRSLVIAHPQAIILYN